MNANPFPMSSVKPGLRRYLGGLIGHSLMISGFTTKAKKRAFSGECITPVFFHNPTKESFRDCMTWLKENDYIFLSSEELLSILRGTMVIPKGAVWISFDDGWRGNIHNAIPTIVENDIPVTIFVSTDPVDRSGVFWWSVAQKHVRNLPPPYNKDLKRLWKIREEERIKIIRDLEQRLPKDCVREAMTTRDIEYLSNIPQITIGSHTVHHVITPNCTESELEFEIAQSRSTLENWTGKPVRLFSYPNGDYDGREKSVLKKFEFELSATTQKRFISVDDDPYLVPRFSVPDNALFPEALCRMLGVFNPFISLGRIFGLAP